MVVRRAALVLGMLLGVFLIVRAIAELFVIDFSDPSSYMHDWGGPTLFGVLLVHCGPGLIAIVLIFFFAWRRPGSAGADLDSRDRTREGSS
jgi:hypothetical protein